MVRKGAWTAEEDMLLKNCIEKYGEGKWHLVPLKAGLNRCRKSCRLRWLNYLRPNIKRGNFGEDEVDLILRLHKLLGNRWALIAGRIPGRTANDVKNYWNTHIRTRAKQQKGKFKDDEPSHDTMVTLFKPLPQTFSKTLNRFVGDNQKIAAHNSTSDQMTAPNDDGLDRRFSMSPTVVSPPGLLDDKINEYWDDLFDEPEKEIIDGEASGWSFGGSSMEGEALNVVGQEDGQNSLFHFPVDEVTWDFLDSEQM